MAVVDDVTVAVVDVVGVGVTVAVYERVGDGVGDGLASTRTTTLSMPSQVQHRPTCRWTTRLRTVMVTVGLLCAKGKHRVCRVSDPTEGGEPTTSMGKPHACPNGTELVFLSYGPNSTPSTST